MKMNFVIQDGEGANERQTYVTYNTCGVSMLMPLLFSINFSELSVIHGCYKLTDTVELFVYVTVV
jgi:hypothetical protein